MQTQASKLLQGQRVLKKALIKHTFKDVYSTSSVSAQLIGRTCAVKVTGWDCINFIIQSLFQQVFNNV